VVPRYQFRTEIAVPQRCGGTEGGAEVPTSVKDNIDDTSLLANHQGTFSWTKFHIAKVQNKSDFIRQDPNINAVLPDIDHSSNDVNLQLIHVMKMAMEYTQFLNEDQGTAVGCLDRLLHAMKKILQWAYTELFPSKSYSAMMSELISNNSYVKSMSSYFSVQVLIKFLIMLMLQ